MDRNLVSKNADFKNVTGGNTVIIGIDLGTTNSLAVSYTHLYIGDCAGERPSNIDHAIKSAYDVACEI